LATPNLCYMGHYVPKVAFLGRRRHSLDKLLVLYRTMRLLMCSVFAVRHIGCRGYDTILPRLCNSLCEARSRPLLARCHIGVNTSEFQEASLQPLYPWQQHTAHRPISKKNYFATLLAP